MVTKFKKIIDELKENNDLKIANEQFSDETILNEIIQCSIIGDTTFSNMNFKNVDLTGSDIPVSHFKNCQFDNVMFLKCQFWNSIFENCQIENCNLVRAEFFGGTFKNCNFINVDLTATCFYNFEWYDTELNSSKFDFVFISSSKICKSNHCIEIDQSSDIETIIKEVGLLVDDDG